MSSRSNTRLEIPIQAAKHSDLVLRQRGSLQLSPDALSDQEMSRQTHPDSNTLQLLPGAQAGKTDIDEECITQEGGYAEKGDNERGVREHFKANGKPRASPAIITRILRKKWQRMSANQKTPWYLLARSFSKEHKRLYPRDEFLQPGKTREMPSRPAKKVKTRTAMQLADKSTQSLLGMYSEHLQLRLQRLVTEQGHFEIPSPRPFRLAVSQQNTSDTSSLQGIGEASTENVTHSTSTHQYTGLAPTGQNAYRFVNFVGGHYQVPDQQGRPPGRQAHSLMTGTETSGATQSMDESM